MYLRICSMMILLSTASIAAEPPAPYGPVPSERQLRWHGLEMVGFIHFTINTFTDKEWGYGDESPALFNPTDFDADQIAQTAREVGLRGLVLTCKHHDGFCLWPSQYTEHSIKKSPWRGGKGDLVREISDACKRQGVLFGVYLSPWDRNHKDYGKPEYVAYYRNQLRELLTNYGPVFEMWFDGANGGDGFYGGAREKRQIDQRTYYDWDNTWSLVRELQPLACMFSDAGPDIRWVGNEKGFAGETCWATLNRDEFYPGIADPRILNAGQRPGTHWLPAEVDVSIRPGWFYHEKENSEVKTAAQLAKIYFESVGRGANLILNLPPDRRGQLHGEDLGSLGEWRSFLEDTFAEDLAQKAKLVASNVRGGDARFGEAALLDGNRGTYWCTDDDVNRAEVVVDFGEQVTFNVVRLREFLPLGQRVEAIGLDRWEGERWVEFATATSIGNQRLVVTPYQSTAKLRLRVTKAAACPALSELGVFATPVFLSDPVITRDGAGMVSIACEWPGPEIRYTTNGTDPSAASKVYSKPFMVPGAGTIRARAFLTTRKAQSAVTEAKFEAMKGKR